MNGAIPILAPLLLGFAFGFVLQRGGLGRYETIVNVFRFTDLTVVKFLLAALMTGMIGVQSLVALGVVDDVPVAPTYVLGNLAGGLVFGAAMAFAGFCPGTVAAGAGEGRLDYAIAGNLGLYVGAVLFGALYPRVFPRVASVASFGPVTIARALDVDPWLVVLGFVAVGAFVIYALERGLPVIRPSTAPSRRWRRPPPHGAPPSREAES